MKVIITGGTGLIGRALARSLVPDGHEVVVLTRNPDQKRPQLPDEVRMVQWDAATAQGWAGEVEDAAVIINLAGETIGPEAGLWTEGRRRRILESRVNATTAVVEAIRGAKQKPGLLLQGSAVGYYGTHSDEIITEGAPAGNDFLAGVVKQWETASDPVEAEGVRRVISRTGVVFAESGSTLDIIALPFKMFVGGPLGSGSQYLPWIHIDDLVGAMRFVMERPEISGPVNMSAPNPVTNREMAGVMGKVLGRPSFVPAPGFLLKLALGDQSIIVLEGQRAVPQRLKDEGYEFHFPNLEGALRDLLK